MKGLDDFVRQHHSKESRQGTRVYLLTDRTRASSLREAAGKLAIPEGSEVRLTGLAANGVPARRWRTMSDQPLQVTPEEIAEAVADLKRQLTAIGNVSSERIDCNPETVEQGVAKLVLGLIG